MMRAILAGVRTPAILLVSWQMVVTALAPPRYILPAPLEVAEAFLRLPGYLADNALITLGEVVVGFVVGTVLGIATALVVEALPPLRRIVWPVVLVLQAFPVFVLAPVLVLWFGFGMTSKVVMTTLIIFFPVASAFADGLRRIKPDLIDAVALTEASHLQGLFLVRVPLALPSLVSGLRVAAPLAPLGAVIGEWVGASGGLGFVMMQATARMQTDIVFAAMVIIAIMTLALRYLVDLAGPLLTPWCVEDHSVTNRKRPS